MPFGLQTSQRGVNILDGRPKALDEFVFLQLGLWVLVLGKGGVDADVDGSGAGAVKHQSGSAFEGFLSVQTHNDEAGACSKGSAKQATVHVELTTVKYERLRGPPRPDDLARVARLLLELPKGTFLQGLVGVDQAGGELNDHLAGRGSKLLLQQDFNTGAIGGVASRDDVDGVDGAVLGSRGAAHSLPGAHLAVSALVFDPGQGLSA